MKKKKKNYKKICLFKKWKITEMRRLQHLTHVLLLSSPPSSSNQKKILLKFKKEKKITVKNPAKNYILKCIYKN